MPLLPVCVCMSVYMYVRMHVEARGQPQGVPEMLSTFVFESLVLGSRAVLLVQACWLTRPSDPVGL